MAGWGSCCSRARSLSIVQPCSSGSSKSWSPITRSSRHASSARPIRPLVSTIRTSSRSTTASSTAGAHYIATEYVDGVDLATLLASESPLPWRIAAMIALEVARGLEAIHSEGTLHRDLKPQNLLVGRHGEVKITDFGLALDTSGSTLTQPGIAVGTPPYMAPEQLRGERVDTRADLFAFGCVLYEMLMGSPPFAMPKEDENESLLARVESGSYPRMRSTHRKLPRTLRRIVRQCLKPRAARRIASATEIRKGLEALLDRPSAADLRRGLSSWLWERHVLRGAGARDRRDGCCGRVRVGHRLAPGGPGDGDPGRDRRPRAGGLFGRAPAPRHGLERPGRRAALCDRLIGSATGRRRRRLRGCRGSV